MSDDITIYLRQDPQNDLRWFLLIDDPDLLVFNVEGGSHYSGGLRELYMEGVWKNSEHAAYLISNHSVFAYLESLGNERVDLWEASSFNPSEDEAAKNGLEDLTQMFGQPFQFLTKDDSQAFQRRWHNDAADIVHFKTA